MHATLKFAFATALEATFRRPESGMPPESACW